MGWGILAELLTCAVAPFSPASALGPTRSGSVRLRLQLTTVKGKVFGYTRVALGSEHSPVDEKNTPDARNLRNGIVQYARVRYPPWSKNALNWRFVTSVRSIETPVGHAYSGFVCALANPGG